MESDINTKKLLKNIFGYDDFLPDQERIVHAIADGKSVVAIMPTGGGKSLCYQLPSRILPGTVVVVSPLIALMKDQVDAARENGFRASYLNHTLAPDERTAVKNDIRAGRLELLYIAPETLIMDWFAPVLDGINISLFAIDEAHCISEWGHDFRPDYLKLGSLRERFPSVPIAAFTATATTRAQSDIIEKLGLEKPAIVRASFNRPNLIYEVKKKTDKVEDQLLKLAGEHTGLPGIIYRTTRDSVEATASFLKKNGVRAIPYHAGMDNEIRARHQDMFQEDEADVVVATIAFGMGIDKPNVRFVAHADLPKNIESYYQETGRAGRDGKPSRCVMFYSGSDIFKIKFFIEKMESEKQRRIAFAKMNSMAQYAKDNVCRRKQLLGYFNESLKEENCGGCDVCGTMRTEAPAAKQRSASKVSETVNAPTSPQEAVKKTSPSPKPGAPAAPLVRENHELFERLRKLRKKFATDKKVSPYVVFPDTTLWNMCSVLPKTKEQMTGVSGIGPVKWDNYGQAFLNEIKKYVVQKRISAGPPSAPPPKPCETKQEPILPAPNLPMSDSRLAQSMHDFLDKRLKEKGLPRSDFYIANETRKRIVQARPDSIEDLRKIEALSPKTISAIGEDILYYVRQFCHAAETKPPVKEAAPLKPPGTSPKQERETPLQAKVAPLESSPILPPEKFWTEEKKSELTRLAKTFSSKQLETIFQRPKEEILEVYKRIKKGLSK